MGKKHDFVIAAKSLHMPTGVGKEYAHIQELLFNLPQEHGCRGPGWECDWRIVGGRSVELEEVKREEGKWEQPRRTW